MNVPIRQLRMKTGGRVQGCNLRGLVEGVQPLRQREYNDGLVFNFTLVDDAGERLRVFLYDEWAQALTFVGNGDWVSVKHAFNLALSPEERVPSTAGYASLAHAANREVHIRTEVDTEITVEQQAEHDDVLELTVHAKCFDNPIAKVKRPQRSNGLVIATSVSSGKTIAAE